MLVVYGFAVRRHWWQDRDTLSERKLRLSAGGGDRVVEGQSHVADPLAFAVVLAQFFTP